ncbi:C-C chemokine receptor type 7 [Xenopus laevis]|nr:C-C chemokine receptor type 7 [Xenopus laevis]
MIGNSLVLLTYWFCRKIKSMTDVYLISLALADILLVLSFPFLGINAIQGWIFGNIMCKVVRGLYSVNFFSGFLFLTCISVDRYIEIVQAVEAHKFRHKSIYYSKLTCIIVWALSLLLTLPQLIYSHSEVVNGFYHCKMIFPEEVTTTVKGISNIAQIIFGFIVPSLVMVFCYSVIIKTLQSSMSFRRHKTLKVVISLVVVFVMFQLPYSVVIFLETTDILQSKQMPCEVSKQKDVALIITSSLAFTRCCLNPILYAFIGVTFRRDILLLLKNLGCISRVSTKYNGPKRLYVSSVPMDTSSFSL